MMLILYDSYAALYLLRCDSPSLQYFQMKRIILFFIFDIIFRCDVRDIFSCIWKIQLRSFSSSKCLTIAAKYLSFFASIFRLMPEKTLNKMQTRAVCCFVCIVYKRLGLTKFYCANKQFLSFCFVLFCIQLWFSFPVYVFKTVPVILCLIIIIIIILIRQNFSRIIFHT